MHYMSSTMIPNCEFHSKSSSLPLIAAAMRHHESGRLIEISRKAFTDLSFIIIRRGRETRFARGEHGSFVFSFVFICSDLHKILPSLSLLRGKKFCQQI
jgi:hypothetical protein